MVLFPLPNFNLGFFVEGANLDSSVIFLYRLHQVGANVRLIFRNTLYRLDPHDIYAGIDQKNILKVFMNIDEVTAVFNMANTARNLK